MHFTANVNFYKIKYEIQMKNKLDPALSNKKGQENLVRLSLENLISCERKFSLNIGITRVTALTHF
jgi:hypothetical protein